MAEWFIFVSGLGWMIAGVLAYMGRWTKWAEKTGFSTYSGFAFLYAGAAAAVLSLTLLMPLRIESGDVRLAYAFFWLAVGAVGLVGFQGWLPPFLLPRWFKEGREQRREVDRAEKELRKTAKSLKRARRGNE